MPIEYRPITEEEFAAFRRAEARAFLHHLREEELPFARRRVERERSLAAFDGGEIVGTIGAYSFGMTVPGAADVPTAGVTDATVQATHRRRGIFTELVRRQLADVHERGEAVAALWTSEAPIYGRFGYGTTSLAESWKIDRRHGAYGRAYAPEGSVGFVDLAEARRAAPGVWERVRMERPTMIGRSEAQWDDRFRDPEHRRQGASAYFCAVYRHGNRVEGYVLYRIRDRWEEHVPAATLHVSELVAATDAAHAALWRLCLDVDLVGTVEAHNRPVDDPLPWRLEDPRRLRRQVHDAVWLRVVDVGRVLGARRYAREGRLVVEVKDAFCPWNQGRYALESGPDGAECRRTQAEAGVRLDAVDLAAAYMGAVRLSTLARAGRVEASSEAALRSAEEMFVWHVAPWCPEVF